MAEDEFDRTALREDARRDIDALVRHHAALVQILALSLKLPVDVRPERLVSKIERATGIPSNEITLLFTALGNLDYIHERVKSADKVHSQIAKLLDGSLLDQWNEYEEEIVQAVGLYNGDNPVALSLKARSLAFNFENILMDAEVLTDARPVFSKDGSEISDYVISHTLVVQFGKSGVSRRIHFALDAEDILRLRRGCERATTKATVLKKTLSKSDVPAQVLNDDDI